MSPQLGTFGAWFNPSYDDDTRVRFVAEAEALGFGTAWLGLGRRMLPDLTLVERALDATTTIVVATAIVNMWSLIAARCLRAGGGSSGAVPGIGVQALRTWVLPSGVTCC